MKNVNSPLSGEGKGHLLHGSSGGAPRRLIASRALLLLAHLPRAIEERDHEADGGQSLDRDR